MNKISSHKKETSLLLRIIGQHLERYNLLLIVLFAIVLGFNVALSLGWYFSVDEVPLSTEITFYIVQATLFIATIGVIVFLILLKRDKIGDFIIGLVNHIYAAFLVAWGTTVFCLDLSLGFSPITFLLVSTLVAGIFIIDPIFFGIIDLLSLIPISVTIVSNRAVFFGGQYFAENLALFLGFIILNVVICFRNFSVIRGEFKFQNRLEQLSYRDELTGLFNGRSYVNEVERIDKEIAAGKDVKFAVVLMDVNNLKATNDAYGHRYGCCLVVRCGHLLPTLFPTSKAFHVGGDEFIVIVRGEDYKNFDKIIEEFDKTMLYNIYEYEGQQLIFSVARGYRVRENGERYKDVLQVADKEMYANKKYLKEKYNMKGR